MKLTADFEMIKPLPFLGSRSAVPQVTISKSGIRFSLALVEQMGNASHVAIYINKASKQLIVMPVPDDVDGARKFFNAKGKRKAPSFNSRILLKEICEAGQFKPDQYRYYLSPEKVEGHKNAAGFSLVKSNRVKI